MVDTCDCREDGYCPRYDRPMGGRMRELCAGVGVDLGTAAAFREQWAREAGPTGTVMRAGARGAAGQCCPGTVGPPGPPRRLLLRTSQAPGDAVAMTAAIYSLHQAHPGRYATAVESYWPEVFQHDHDVVLHQAPGSGVPLDFLPVQMHYPAIHQSNDRGVHFMQGWCEHLGAALGADVPHATNRPRLYFADPAPPAGDYWLVCSGGKRDFTTKLWGRHSYQEVVDRLRGEVRFVQVGGGRPPVPWAASQCGSQEDDHPRLAGAEDAVGATCLRGLFDLARRARGVLCGVSLLMHVAAALERPAVVVAGGREPVAWNAYPLQQYVHTVGALPCRDASGRAGVACWRYRTVPLGDGTSLDRDTCERPVNGTPTRLTRATVPECMAMIRPAEVAALVLRYNRQYE